MEVYYFCTYFDHNYLSKGLALHRSLETHCPNFQLFVLCLSKECYEILQSLNLSHMTLISLEEFEKDDSELLRAKNNRSVVEYYFTCTPSLLLYIFKHYDISFLTYLDADLYFFSSPEAIYDELGENSIGIIGHCFSSNLRHLDEKGVYNVGWMSFRRDRNGLDCLQWYREKCNEWCYDRVEGDRYADQKYLDRFEELFAKVHVMQHKGANLAPWNIANYKIIEKNTQIWVDEQSLIFFHFQGFKKLAPSLYDSGFAGYQAEFSKIVRDKIYLPYIKTLEEGGNSIHLTANNEPSVIRGRTQYERFQKALPRLFNLLRTCKRIARVIYTNNYIFVNDHKKT